MIESLDVVVPLIFRRLGVGFAHNRREFSVFSFQWSVRKPRLFDPHGVAHHSPGSRRFGRAPWVKARRRDVPCKGSTRAGAGPETMCNPFRVESFRGLNPGCATKASRPWAVVFIPFREQQLSRTRMPGTGRGRRSQICAASTQIEN